jgi:two-component system response regulator NreC
VIDMIRVLIADDHTIVRSGVRLLLESEADIEVVAEAVDGDQALSLVEELLPDVVLMDIAMPGTDGLQATRQIKERWPDINVLVLTMHRQEEYFFELLKAGASGYLLKGAETNDLIRAVRVVSQGEVFLYPSMAQRLVKDYLDRVTREPSRGSVLSPREQEILSLLAEGYDTNAIAEKLVISPSTVHTHRSNIMQKLELSTRHELVQYARQHGLIQDY